MPIGTSDGEYYEDSMAYSMRDVTPTMPLQAPEKPAGALESSGGTEPPDYDYDSWKAANPGVEMQPGQHYPDTYKLPNHMTFSDESIYHGVNGAQGGHWGTDGTGADTFTPGPTNLQQHSIPELQDYFRRVEPNAKLILPETKLPDFTDQYGTPTDKQIWPERLVSSAIKAFQLPGDVLSGKVQPGSVQEIERATDLAGLMVGGPAPVAAKMADGTLGSFAGVTSKTIDKGALQTARDALAQGVHPDEVWEKTGFFKGADNRWRYEIPDENAKLNDTGFDVSHLEATGGNGQWDVGGREAADLYTVKDKVPTGSLTSQSTRLPDVLNHPDLYEAYPFLRSTKVLNFPYKTESYGQMDAYHNTMYLNKELHPEFARSVILHELQHAIQSQEGFARGGSPREFTENFGKNPDEAFELYKRFMGEVEARNVQARMNFNEAQRMASPRSTEDRPRFVQIPASQSGPALLPK